MTAPYTQLFVHAVWSTLGRRPMVTEDVEAQVYGAIADQCHLLNVVVAAVGGTPDHVHLLARVPPLLPAAELIEQVKSVTVALMTQKVRPGWLFEWQPAYGAFSVSTDAVPRAIQYIRNQKALHAANTLWDDWERCGAPAGSE